MEVGGKCHTPASLPPGKKLETHCKGGWVRPRVSLHVLEKRKISCPTGIQTLDLQT